MHKLTTYLPFLALLLLSFSCGNAPTQKQDNNAGDIVAKNLDVAEFEKMIAEKPGIILDVRTQDEYNQGHIEDCVLIDWYGSTFNQEAEKLDKQKPIYVYCRSGSRSSAAMKRLTSLGFVEVYNLKGGIIAWNAKH